MPILTGLTFALAWLAYQQSHQQSQKPTRAPERVLEWPEFEDSGAEVRATQEQAIVAARRQLDVIVTQSPEQLTFESTLVARDALIHEFTRHWYRMELLQNVSPDQRVREAAGAAATAMEQWYVESIELGEPLYQIVEAFSRTAQAAALTDADRLLLDDVLDDYRREGLTLSPDDRAQITAWRARLTELTTQIDLNIQAAEGLVAFEPEQLEGLGDEQPPRCWPRSATCSMATTRAITVTRGRTRSQPTSSRYSGNRSRASRSPGSARGIARRSSRSAARVQSTNRFACFWAESGRSTPFWTSCSSTDPNGDHGSIATFMTPSRWLENSS
jgi:Zn-dependent oligopeptidase